MATIHVTTGSEGPRHDPYAYTEWRFKRTDGKKGVLHEGLARWAEIDGKRVACAPEEAHILFERFIGTSMRQLEKAWNRIRYRCKACGSTGTRVELGYPGEYFNVCARCGEIVSMDFCESEVV